jgi:hypothetical protein
MSSLQPIHVPPGDQQRAELVCVQDNNGDGDGHIFSTEISEPLLPTEHEHGGSPPDSNISERQSKDGGAAEHEHVRLPWVVRVLNLVLFGNGRCWALPLLLGGGELVFALYATLFEPNVYTGALTGTAYTAYVLSNIAMGMEAAVNAYFGYHFCRAGHIAHLVRIAERHGITERDAMRVLGRCAWAAATASAAWLVSNGAAGASADTTLSVAASMLENAYVNFAMLYPLALWLWINYLFWHAGRHVVTHCISTSSVEQGQASAAVFGLLDEMRSASRVWTVNHAVRIASTVILAESLLHLALWRISKHHVLAGHPTDAKQIAVDISAAAVLILAVLATAAAPGYVTTSFYESTQTKLAALAHAGQATAESAGADEECQMLPPQDTPTSLMQRISAAGSGAGMHFSGVPMTVEKAIAVATAIFYVTRHFAMPEAAPVPWWNGTAVVNTPT